MYGMYVCMYVRRTHTHAHAHTHTHTHAHTCTHTRVRARVHTIHEQYKVDVIGLHYYTYFKVIAIVTVVMEMMLVADLLLHLLHHYCGVGRLQIYMYM